MNHVLFKRCFLVFLAFALTACSDKNLFKPPLDSGKGFGFYERETVVPVDAGTRFFELGGRVPDGKGCYVNIVVVPEYTTAVENLHYILPRYPAYADYEEEEERPGTIGLLIPEGVLEKSIRIKIDAREITSPLQIAFTNENLRYFPPDKERVDTTVIKLIPLSR